jgi:hypothetical protein
MAKFAKGILGAFLGKVGTVIGSTWKGIPYMRSLSGKRSNAGTQKQIEQQAKFGVAVNFLHTMKDLLQIGYKSQATRMTEVNAALAHFMKNAISGVYPVFTIQYPQVLISRGNLPNAGAPTAAPGIAGVINFHWSDNSGTGSAKPGDKAILVAYCDALKQTVYIMDPLRSEEAGNLSVPAFSGKPVQTWISFVTEDGKDIATSVFTGVVNVI